ncbi:hypothetical protein WUBG_13517, partial [Wuchereria bancrofti]
CLERKERYEMTERQISTRQRQVSPKRSYPTIHAKSFRCNVSSFKRTEKGTRLLMGTIRTSNYHNDG